METNEMNTGTISNFSAEGTEIQISTNRVNVVGVIAMLLLIVGGLLAYYYIWGYTKSLLDHRYLWTLVGFAGYIVLQIVLLLIFSKGNFRALGFTTDWRSWGPLSKEPMALKYYRVALAVPGIVFGVIPAIHGFCIGDVQCYLAGAVLMAGSCGDYLFLWKLRHFNDEDKIVDGKESYRATIIKGAY